MDSRVIMGMSSKGAAGENTGGQVHCSGYKLRELTDGHQVMDSCQREEEGQESVGELRRVEDPGEQLFLGQ